MKYPPSIVTDDLEHCFICQLPYAEVHHIMGGNTGHRAKSTKYGLTVGLCKRHHTMGKDAIHNNRQFMDSMKKVAQLKFEELYSRELWIKEFGKNYL